MRVKAITPIRVGPEEVERRQHRYERLSPAGLEIELFDLPDRNGVPTSLETVEDIAASDVLVTEEALRTPTGVYDAILPDCVLDPGIDALAEEAPAPVFGILRLSAGLLIASGLRFAAAARNRAIGDELVSRLSAYGYTDAFDRLIVLDLPFEAVAEAGGWEGGLGDARATLEGSGVGALLNGCSAVDVPAERGIAIVDPTRLALALLGVALTSGLGNDRSGARAVVSAPAESAG